MTFVKTVSIDDLVSEIRKVAAAEPNLNYREVYGAGCDYVRKSEAGEYHACCLVGQAFVNLGIDPARLDIDKEFTHPSILDLVSEDIEDCSDDFNWVADAQVEQDAGVTWAKSIERADANLTERKMRN